MNQHSNTPRVCVCVVLREPLSPAACASFATYSRLPPWQVLGTTIYFTLAQKSKVKKEVVELKKVLPTLRADTYEARMCPVKEGHTHTHAYRVACMSCSCGAVHTQCILVLKLQGRGLYRCQIAVVCICACTCTCHVHVHMLHVTCACACACAYPRWT